MSGRREKTPPGKPSVSRLSLGKIKGKQGSPGSISIRFNAASMDDDYDLDDDLSIGGSSSTKPRSDSVKFEITKDDSRVYSQSAPTSEVNTPVSAGTSLARPTTNSRLVNDCTSGPSTGNSEETTPLSGEKSILTGLKERFHDKLPEPINAIIGKIGDLSPDDPKKKFQKSESQESEGSVKLPQSESVDRISVRKSESTESTRGMSGLSAAVRSPSSDLVNRTRSRQGSTESDAASEASNSTHNDTTLKTDTCFEVIEDYYNDDAFDEPSAKTKHSTTSTVGKSSGADPSVNKQRSSSLRKLIGQKDRGSSPARGIKTAMTLSGLLSSKSDDSIHSHTTTTSSDSDLTKDNKAENDEFFDIDNQDSITDDTAKFNDEAKGQSIPSKPLSEDQVTKNTVHKFIAIGVCTIAYLIIPLPSFISGLVLGAALMYCATQAYQWLFVPPKPMEPFVLPDLSNLPALVVPEMKESRNTDGKFQAWMNELQSYTPDDYHINLTASVYVSLEGTTLRLQRPKHNISKRAMWDELVHNPTFIHQRHFDLKGSRVFLEPAGLVRKRLWSKKYPICIALAKDSSRGTFEVRCLSSDKGHSEDEGTSVDKEKKLISQASLDDEKIRPSERKQKRLTMQMSLDEGRLQQMSIDGFEVKRDGEKNGQKENGEENETKDEPEGYEFVSREECDTKILYLFGRTGREKEEWYRRLVAASMGQPWPTRMSDLRRKMRHSEPVASPVRSTSPGPEAHSGPQLRKRHSSSSLESITTKHHQRQGSADSTTFTLPEVSPVTDATTPTKPSFNSLPQSNSNENCYEKVLVQYMRYMSVVLPAKQKRKPGSRATSPVSNISNKKELGDDSKNSSTERCEEYCVWVNTFISRCFWDFLREDYWAEYMKQKIQRKLSKIHVPFFIDDLTVTDIVLGCEMPVIRRMSRPYLDDRGLWIDMDVAYNGGFHMSLETKVNLMKLKKEKMNSHRQSSRRTAVHNEDEEDSAESSTDEEAEVTTYVTANEAEATGGSTGKKLLRLVDKLTQNKYFQQATENKFVKRAMEGVSNTPLMLNVELRSLTGTLAVNIPPPPTDRIWYGFRTNPRLWLSAKPKVGERAVTVTHVTEWIEKKLAIEFQRVFVMPNMDDLPIPLMCDHLADNQPTFESAL